ncbi:MAG: Hsp70 family protein [Acidobacteriota bacterium]
MSKTVGIDLGTTNSLVAVVRNGRPEVLARPDERLVPSVVGLSEDGRIIVGREALNQYILAPERTVRSIKRLMGSDERVTLGDRSYLPEEISAFILRYLKQMAEEVTGENIERAVITVPAYFGDNQRHATQRAGEMAGLEVARIINEPTAAALCYGVEKKSTQYLMVYDLGGGTFDVSIIEQQDEILEVRSSHGNTRLGGDDFDQLMLEHLIEELSEKYEYDFKEDRRAMARLVRAAEQAKIALSTAPYARVSEEFLARYDGQIANLDAEVSREDLEEMIAPLLSSTVECVDRAILDSGIAPQQISRVLMVGGSTRIPRVWDLIRERIGLEPSLEVNPDEAVALGAAVQAAIIDGESIDAMLIDVSPHSLGIEVADMLMGQVVAGFFRPIIRRNTAIPTTRSEKFYTLSPRQDTVEVRIFQGESQLCAENTELGSFKFTDIPPSEDPDMNREVIVEFSYNINGIVEVTARDHRGARRERMTVSAVAAKRSVSEPERKRHFDPALERDVARALEDAARIELQLDADGEKKDAQKLRKARHALEEAYEQGTENRVRKQIEALEDILYDFEK